MRNLCLGMTTIAVMALIGSSTSAQDSKSAQYHAKTYDYDFTGKQVEEALGSAAGSECVKVRFDDSVASSTRTARVNLKLKNATPAQAIREIIKSHGLNYEYVNHAELLVFQGKTPKAAKLIDVTYRSTNLRNAIEQIAHGHFNIVIDDAVKGVMLSSLTLEIRDTTRLRALEEVLDARHLTYHRVACDILFIHSKRTAPLK